MKKNLLIVLGLLAACSTSCAVMDNRYFPWNGASIIHSVEGYSGVRPTLFFVNANEAYGSATKEKKGIPELFGNYDQKLMSDTLLFIGQTTPLLAQWQLQRTIEWHVKQKIEGQGVRVSGEHLLGKGFSFGYSGGFMHLFSDQAFSLPRSVVREIALQPAQEQELDRERRAMFEQLGLVSSQWAAHGLLDTTLYVRFGKGWNYQAKCRQVYLSAFAGVVLPTGEKRQINNTASIPFDGNGAAGFFIGTDNAFELKEDMTFGFLVQLSGRQEKKMVERIPVKQENYLFGALQGDVSIDPGVTVAVRPYFALGNIRDGLDLCVQYAYTNHAGDVWKDMRVDQSTVSNLNGMYDKSEWRSEYVSLTVLYDSGKVMKRNELRPSLRFSWDIPVHMFAAHEVSRTHVLGVGIEVCF